MLFTTFIVRTPKLTSIFMAIINYILHRRRSLSHSNKDGIHCLLDRRMSLMTHDFSTARTLNFELVLLIVICVSEGGGADDKCVIHVVQLVYGKMSAFSQPISHLA